MAGPDSDLGTSSQGAIPEMWEPWLISSDSDASEISQMTSNFHYYMNLPFELRSQIRTEAMRKAQKRSLIKKPLSRLASVSKEWRVDVEKVLFCEIRINPSEKRETSTFKRLFTDSRRKFLTRLDIAIDDDEETSPWHQRMGLLKIRQLMKTLGQFFHYINGWNFCREGEKQQCIEIVFTCHGTSGYHGERYRDPWLFISSLWEKKDLDFVTFHGLIPPNIALWAIKFKFPPSLNMVTHLTFPPDCVPVPAAKKVIQTMPNLETCVLKVKFGSDCGEGWRNFTDFIHQLRISAPSLRKLMLHSRDDSSHTFVPPSMKIFAAALRDYSQSLELLRVSILDLHPAFFLQSSEEVNPAAARSQWRWPRLQELELLGSFGRSYLTAHQLKITPTEILIAAGTAATAMPVLEIANIKVRPNQYFHIKREPCKGFQGFRNASIRFVGFDEREEQRILTAWAHFIGGEARLAYEEIDDYDDEKPTIRDYMTIVEAEHRF